MEKAIPVNNCLQPLTWIHIYLDALRQSGIISDAARQAGVAPSIVYAMMQRDKGFKGATEAAIQESIDALEKTARFQALTGNTAILCKLLESYRPEKFQRKQTLTNINATISVNTDALLQRIASKQSAKSQVITTSYNVIESKDAVSQEDDDAVCQGGMATEGEGRQAANDPIPGRS